MLHLEFFYEAFFYLIVSLNSKETYHKITSSISGFCNQKNYSILIVSFSFLCVFGINILNAEDGYRMWIRYDRIADNGLLNHYRQNIRRIVINEDSETMLAVKNEIRQGLSGLLDVTVDFGSSDIIDGTVIIGTLVNLALISSLDIDDKFFQLGDEGFLIGKRPVNGYQAIIITANSYIGLLYGTFHFFSLLQTHQTLNGLSISSSPRVQLRVVNHWDNIDRLVEKGYAGLSLWEW